MKNLYGCLFTVLCLLSVIQTNALTLTESHSNVSCHGGNDGTINIITLGGVAPFAFLWNDGNNQQNRSGLIAGNYSVTATDNLGVTSSISINITQPGNISININSTQPNCNGGSDGIINVISVVGGTGPYTFIWSDGSTQQNRTGLTAGSYSVIATSSTGCTASTNIILGEPTAISISLTPISLTCYGSNNGAINTTVTGGNPAYSYIWSDGAITKNRTGLASGSYSLTVTDLKGCTATAPSSTFVPQPLQLSATATPSDLACTGGPTGSVFTSVSGGNAPYSYWWGSGVVSPNRVNVNSGTYTVTVTDANGCSSTASATIPPYTALTLSTSQVNNVCHGGQMGIVTALVNNGWTPYQYLWSNDSTTQSIQSLSAGNYTVTVIDNHGCTISKSATITQPGFPMVINSTVSDVYCHGGNNGSITLNVQNGLAPYTYNWGGGINTLSRSGLTAGAYPVTVTDNLGCSGSITINVNQPTLLTASASSVSATCFGATNGKVELNANGGWAPYTFLWSNNATTEDLLTVPAGIYTVTVTDNLNCTATASTIVGQPTAITSAIIKTDVSCFGGNNGIIHTTTSGGTSPYQFIWENGATTSGRTGLISGSYSLTVTDQASCHYTTSVVINQPSPLMLQSTVTGASCNGGSDGSISMNITGGTPPYSYLWTDGVSVKDRNNIPAASYYLSVTDAASCVAKDTITVGEASVLNVSTQSNDVSCFGKNDGAIQLMVSGGTSPYSYQWSDLVTTQNRNSILAGAYHVTVTDQAACTAGVSVNIQQPLPVLVSSTVVPVKCYNGSDGSIQLNVSGGTLPYSFNWGGGITTQNRSAIQAGTYQVTVTDNNSCTATHSSIVSQPADLTLSNSMTPVSCFGGYDGAVYLSVAGGVAPYSYQWTNGTTASSVTGINAGSYSVTVTDNNLCVATGLFNITQPSALQVSLSKIDIACFAQSNGRIDVTVTGGTPDYHYNWGNGVSTQNLTGISTGNYTVTVTDLNNCTATATETIIQPGQMSTTIFSIINPSCHGLQDGSVDIGVNGGTAPYAYEWSNGSTNKKLTGAHAGNHSVTVTDANSCTALTSINLTQPAAIQVQFNKSDISCHGLTDGSITANATGGRGGFSYQWNNNSTLQTLNQLSAATYTITVKDISNCSTTASVTISEPAVITISETHQDVSCNGAASGTITIQTTGGTGAHHYRWEDNSTTAFRNNLGHGTYDVTVTDVNSCTAQKSITINEVSGIQITEQHSDFACSAKPGSASIQVSGGIPPYRYLWNDGVNIKDRSGMLAGSYSVTVADAASCSSSKDIVIDSLPSINASVSVSDSICSGTSDGFISVMPTGGKPGYSYLWNTGAVSPTLTNIPAGNYFLTITDGNGCTEFVQERIAEISGVQVAETIQHATCYGQSTGNINLIISGGKAPYYILWNNGDTSQNLQHIAAGTYFVKVTDANQCSFTKPNIVVNQPAEISIQPLITPAGCAGENSGAVSLNISGGTGLYYYQWNNQQITASIRDLSPGDYSVTVTDGNQCSSTVSFHVDKAQPVAITGNAHNTSCPQVENGRIDLQIQGGSPVYTFSWSHGASSQNLKSLKQGNYSVTVSDSKGCQATSDFIIGYDYDLSIQASSDVTILSGQTAELSVNTTNDHRNKCTWFPSSTVVCSECRDTRAYPKESTTYTVEVIDQNGCRAADSLRVEVRELADRIFIPNAFTPNKDGNNDVLEFYGDRTDIRRVNFALFNRSGEKVFESDDLQFQWDGTYKGETAPTGVYRYVMEVVFSDGTGKDIQGSVTILR